MSIFKETFEETLKLEGGYVLHHVEGDPGGMTYAGISRKAWPDWEGWKLIDSGYSDSYEGLKNLVADFYHVNFWCKIRGDEINSVSLSSTFFDHAVNAGVSEATKIMQKLVDVRADGIVGPETLKAINECTRNRGSLGVSARYGYERLRFYSSLVEEKPALAKFFRGWVNRVISVHT